jgi:hypothetical protein
MKWTIVIVLLSIAQHVIAPPFLSLTPAVRGHSMIGTLDVCRATSPALSSNGDMPCLNEFPYQLLSAAPPLTAPIVSLAGQTFILTFQDELPPKV